MLQAVYKQCERPAVHGESLVAARAVRLPAFSHCDLHTALLMCITPPNSRSGCGHSQHLVLFPSFFSPSEVPREAEGQASGEV